MNKVEPTEPGIIYRVYIDPSLGDAKVMTVGEIGIGVTDPMEGYYPSVQELPLWVQERVAVLSVLVPPDGPIEGVGRRIDRNTFWVYPKENDDDNS